MKNIQKISTGASGAALYDLYGKYILKSTTAESNAWESSVKECKFYQNSTKFNCGFLPEVDHIHADSDCIMLFMKKYDSIQLWDTKVYHKIPVLLAEIHSQDYRILRMTYTPNDNIQNYPETKIHAKSWMSLIQSYSDNEKYTYFDPSLLEYMCNDFEAINNLSVSLPICLIHGDFHRNNILWDRQKSRFCVCDWQNVSVGYGPSDIAFFISRAKSDGETIDEESFIKTYIQSMKSHGVDLDFNDILTIIHKETFAVSFSCWYEYLQNADIQRTISIWDDMKNAYLWLREQI